MNSKVSQPQTRGFLRLIIKAFYLFVGILILGSFTTSYAQKRTIVRNTVTWEKGCPSVQDDVVQISIDGVPMASYQISVSPGPHNLKVSKQKDMTWLNLIIKEIKYDDFESSPDRTTSIPRPQQ